MGGSREGLWGGGGREKLEAQLITQGGLDLWGGHRLGGAGVRWGIESELCVRGLGNKRGSRGEKKRSGRLRFGGVA